jgi:NADH dehydrogenase
LVDTAPRILGQVPDSLAGFATRTLLRRGVEIVPRTSIAGLDRGGAVLSDGRRIETETVVWTVGVAANPAAARMRSRLRCASRLRGRSSGSAGVLMAPAYRVCDNASSN